MFSSSERRAASVLMIGCALLAGCGGGGGGGGGQSPQNRAPVFGVVQFSATEDTDLSAQVTATDADGDALTFIRSGSPTKGTVTAFAANGSFTYRPNRDAFGTDTFTVVVADSPSSGTVGTVTIQIAGVNDPPAAHNDTLTATGAGIASLNVIANDVEVDGDALQVTIESAAEVGTATVNPNKTIAISGLPAGFHGITRFKYKITDPSNTSSVGTAAVFVDVAPFRVVFNGDEQANGSLEVYMTDLVSAPLKLTAATEGNLRLRNFRASRNGSTVVYRRHDLSQSNLPTDLSFVRTANPAVQVRIQLPNDMQLLRDIDNDLDLYVVSPDGQWIGAVASKDPPDTLAVILLNVANPSMIHTASAPDANDARQLVFSNDSQNLYFLAAVPSVGGGYSLFRAAVATPDQSTLLSAPPVGPSDSVTFHAESADQSRVVLTALRNNTDELYYVDPANPRNEIRINHPLNPGDLLTSTAFQLGTTLGGSADGSRVGYSVKSPVGPVQSYIAEVSATPNPRLLGPPGMYVEAIRPDNAAALLATESQTGTDIQTFEKIIDSAQMPTLVADGSVTGAYDATGTAIFTTIFHDLPQPSTSTGSALRPTFGTTAPVGTPGQFRLLLNITAGDRGIALLGEAPQSSAKLFRMALVNAWAPDKLLYLADFPSTQTLRGGSAQAVDP